MVDTFRTERLVIGEIELKATYRNGKLEELLMIHWGHVSHIHPDALAELNEFIIQAHSRRGL